MVAAGPPEVLALLGPTASGKSAAAHAVALALGGEIVVADPFQRYRGLEIAADSPRGPACAAVPHHCVGDLRLDERSTAAQFARHAHAAIDGALDRGAVPIVSGGTGLYVRAALATLSFPDEPSPSQRDAAEDLARRDLTAALAELRRLDPDRADAVDPHNARRVARALAVATAAARVTPVGSTTGGPGELWSDATRRPTLTIALSRPREELDRRIAERVDREMDEGLIAEIEAALDTQGLAREPAQIIGMREVAAMRTGELDRADLPGRLAARTRRLARKQLTWLRKTPGLTVIDLGTRPADDAADEIIALWRAAGGAGR